MKGDEGYQIFTFADTLNTSFECQHKNLPAGDVEFVDEALEVESSPWKLVDSKGFESRRMDDIFRCNSSTESQQNADEQKRSQKGEEAPTQFTTIMKGVLP